VARPEADIARRVREVVGRDAFIAGTFDPHGNEDAEFLRQADFAFCAKYFPHYDSRLQGERAARMLIRAIRGDYTPATATVKVSILTATVLQWTGASPWMDLVQRALAWEAREPDLYMNVFFGFPFADVPDVGMTVRAMSNGKPALARKTADDVAAWAWRRREALLKTATVHPIAEGVKLAKGAVARDAWPVVLADHSDRSGSATWVLQQVIAQDLAGADQGHDRGRGAHRRQALGQRRLRARQRRAHQRISHPGHGPARPNGAGIHHRSVQGICDQVARTLPPRLRRFGLREDHPAGRAGAAVPRHGTARGAALPERRHLQVLSVRRRQLS
jgi:Metallopeptidase family M81